MKEQYDPITTEIIQSSLQAAADEMFAAMRRTAMSAIIYEVLDMGTAICSKDGELASSGAGIPAFVGMLDKAVKRIIEKFDKPGDVEEGRGYVRLPFQPNRVPETRRGRIRKQPNLQRLVELLVGRRPKTAAWSMSVNGGASSTNWDSPRVWAAASMRLMAVTQPDRTARPAGPRGRAG